MRFSSLLPSRALLPVLAAGLGICTFSLMDALMKSASLMVGVYVALFWRCALGGGIALAMWRPSRADWPDGARMKLHVARSVVVAGMAYLFFWGLVRTPMAVGMALCFIAPLIALYLAALFLGEKVTRRALGASLLGLVGVAVIGAGRLGVGGAGVPASADTLWGMLAILGSAVLYAANLVLQRYQAQQTAPAEIAFFQGVLIALILAPGAFWIDLWPPMRAWPLVAGAAVLATTSLALLAWGWARAPAHRLLPVEYTAFIWSAVVGRLWFGEAVAPATLGGVVLIVAACWLGLRQGADPAADSAAQHAPNGAASDAPHALPAAHIEQLGL
ncbi:MAG TPA: DMT family transporter [Novosphingobium sp.]|nr:DMT family transporter [Novosphingobium sp.]